MEFLYPVRSAALAFLCNDSEFAGWFHSPHGIDMLDIIFVAAGLAFFAVGLAYTLLCDRL